MMTIREAFEKAGYPVPEGAKIGSWTISGLWFYSYERCSYWFKHPRGPWEKDGPWGHSYLISVARMIDLSSLPAIDAYDALPEVVKAVVKEQAEATTLSVQPSSMPQAKAAASSGGC